MPPRLSTLMSDDVERRVLSDSVELRFDPEAQTANIVGYSPIFNSLSVDLGGFREKVAPGATKKTIREQDIPLLINHDGLPLASSGSGTMTMREDDRGLRWEATLDRADPDVQRLIPKMRRGDLSKTSFAFEIVKVTWDETQKPPVRTLQEIRLYDVSVVSRPAYPQSEVKLRSLMAGAGVEFDSFPRVMLRVQRGQELTPDDVALLEGACAYLRSLMPSVQTAEAAEPTEPIQEDHSEEPQHRTEPTRTGHSLEESRRLLQRIERLAR
jgi:uncharacterized protein